MIKYKKETYEINVPASEWKKIKNDILKQAITKGLKVAPEEIKNHASAMILKEKTRHYIKQILDPDKKNVPVGGPYIDYIEQNNEFKAVVDFIYYPNEQIKKLDYKNLKIDYKTPTITQKDFDAIFEEFKSNYPITKEVKNRPIAPKDVVSLNLKGTKDNQIVDEQKNVKLQALPSNNFSINSELIGKNIGEIFTLNDPSNVFWTIEIISATYDETIQVTDETFVKLEEQNINSLAELKDEFEFNFKKELYSRELLKYYELCADKIVEQNIIEFSPEFITETMQKIIQSEMRPGGLAQDIKSAFEFDTQKPNHLEIKNLAQASAKKKTASMLLIQAIQNDFEFNVSDELVQKQIDFIQKIHNRSPQSLSFESLRNIIKQQLTILKLMALIDPENAKIFTKALKITE
ncbi:hypothetical protein EG856_00515 [Mycoplasmopsis phocirhinis]|uniref:Trigger factor n=1 Tax=Mycoplasmopsis phocirhinis TaxID=142650 RepID=A0A4P6MQT3_9BACT|nr:hypothetical protein [Mycoplasmopsis phocirhinis]QBF34419.1 hypothetical protein EG856_00515 [Mycoplasmopsis phocirhinis]